MSYKQHMTDRQIARAALKLLHENATLIADTADSNRVWNLLWMVDLRDAELPEQDKVYYNKNFRMP